MSHTAIKSLVVLLVDDDERDLVLVKKAFQSAGVSHPIKTVSNGADCMRYLCGVPPFDDRENHPFPNLILLDINMPDLDGFQVLRWIRQQPQYAKLCVVMLTGSDERPDLNRAYGLGANSFLVKPLDFWNAAEISTAVQRLLAKCER